MWLIEFLEKFHNLTNQLTAYKSQVYPDVQSSDLNFESLSTLEDCEVRKGVYFPQSSKTSFLPPGDRRGMRERDQQKDDFLTIFHAYELFLFSRLSISSLSVLFSFLLFNIRILCQPPKISCIQRFQVPFKYSRAIPVLVGSSCVYGLP